MRTYLKLMPFHCPFYRSFHLVLDFVYQEKYHYYLLLITWVVVVSWHYLLVRLFVRWAWSVWRSTKILCQASTECPSSSQSVLLPSTRSTSHLGWFRCRRWTTSHLSDIENSNVKTSLNNFWYNSMTLSSKLILFIVLKGTKPSAMLAIVVYCHGRVKGQWHCCSDCVPVQLRAQSELQMLFRSFVENFVPVMLVITSGKSPVKWLTWRL